MKIMKDINFTVFPPAVLCSLLPDGLESLSDGARVASTGLLFWVSLTNDSSSSLPSIPRSAPWLRRESAWIRESTWRSLTLFDKLPVVCATKPRTRVDDTSATRMTGNDRDTLNDCIPWRKQITLASGTASRVQWAHLIRYPRPYSWSSQLCGDRNDQVRARSRVSHTSDEESDFSKFYVGDVLVEIHEFIVHIVADLQGREDSHLREWRRPFKGIEQNRCLTSREVGPFLLRSWSKRGIQDSYGISQCFLWMKAATY